MTMKEAMTLLDAFVRYAYNVEFGEFSELFDGATSDYLVEKYKHMQQNLGAFYGALDGEHRAILTRAVVARFHRTTPGQPLCVVEETQPCSACGSDKDVTYEPCPYASATKFETEDGCDSLWLCAECRDARAWVYMTGGSPKDFEEARRLGRK